MGLVLATLTTSLAKLLDPTNGAFAGFPANAATVASNWSTAYNQYARLGVDAGGNPLAAPGAQKAAFASAFTLPNGTTAAAAASIIAQAFVAYWTAAAFTPATPPSSGTGGTGVFSAIVSSVVAAVVPTTLIANLSTELTSVSTSGAVKASNIAGILHSATTANVTVLITGIDTTVPTPVPILNTGNVS